MKQFLKKIKIIQEALNELAESIQASTKKEEMEMIFLDKIPSSQRATFKTELLKVCTFLGIDPNWLMMVMWAESKVNPRAVNPTSGATGLIQFMPNTARSLGTTTERIKQLDAVEQLYYVQKYFAWKRGKMKSYYDVYAVVFFPAAIGKPDNWILKTPRTLASTIARQNPAINLNKDNEITVAEFKAYVKKTIPKTVVNQVLNQGKTGVNILGFVLLFFLILKS